LNPSDLDLMIKEIDEFIDDIQHDRKAIDPEIGLTQYFKKGVGIEPEGAGTLSDRLSTAITMYRKYKNSESRMRIEYITDCYKWVTKARTLGAIKAGNSIVQELQTYKQQYKNLGLELQDSKSTIEKLREIKSRLEERIRIHENMYPDLKRLGNIEESEVTEDE